MNFFLPIFVYLTPLILGLVIPFLLAIKKQPSNLWVKELVSILGLRITFPVIIIAIVIAIVNIIYPSKAFHLTTLNFLWLIIFLWSLALATGGVYYLLITLGMGRNLTYIIISILVLLMNTTTFYINPFIASFGNNLNIRQSIIKLAIEINPLLTVGSNFFKHDLLRSKEMYSICDIGPYYFYNYPSWTKMFVIYLIISIVSFGLSFGLRKLRNQRT